MILTKKIICYCRKKKGWGGGVGGGGRGVGRGYIKIDWEIVVQLTRIY